MTKISKLLLSTLCFLLWSTTGAFAFQADEDFMAKFEACKAISREKDRLKCFEGLKLKSNNNGKKQTSKVEDKKPAPKSEKQTEKEFGASRLRETQENKKNRELKEIKSTLVEIQQSKYGRSTFFLENGQVWQQNSSDRLNGVTAKKYSGINITIKRKLFGSYTLRFKGRTIKVKRIK